MSIFDNVIFDEFTLLEGEQTEAYKKRKAEEKSAKDKAEKERRDRRYEGLEVDAHSHFVGNTRNLNDRPRKTDSDEKKDKYYDQMMSDERRANASGYAANRRKGGDFNTKFDAINRDMRRHPDRWEKEHESDRIKTVRK